MKTQRNEFAENKIGNGNPAKKFAGLFFCIAIQKRQPLKAVVKACDALPNFHTTYRGYDLCLKGYTEPFCS